VSLCRSQEIAEDRGASADELLALIGRGRTKTGIFEGDLINGELEIGQVASLIQKIEPVEAIIKSLVAEYNERLERLRGI